MAFYDTTASILTDPQNIKYSHCDVVCSSSEDSQYQIIQTLLGKESY